MSEVSGLQEQKDELNEKVTKCEEEIKVRWYV